MSRTTELAWAAALLEGEGSIGWRKWPNHPNRKESLRISVTNTEPVLLYRFHKAVGGGGGVTEHKLRNRKPHLKVSYRFRASGRIAQGVLELLYPHLTPGSRKQVLAGAAIREMRSRKKRSQPNDTTSS